MSNGIDAAAVGSDSFMEVGRVDFAAQGPLANSTDAQNIDGMPQTLDASNGYGQVLDSTNNLGVGGTINLTSSQTGN